jgi:hypothetical protein
LYVGSLSIPSHPRPVVIDEKRYREFMNRVNAREATFVDEIARVDGVSSATVQNAARMGSHGVLSLYETLLLRPGPYAPCDVPAAHARSSPR